MPKHVGELSKNFCDGCPIAEKLGESRAGIYSSEIVRRGGVDVLTVVNMVNKNFFREEIIAGSITHDSVQEAVDNCDGPQTQERRILPNRFVCGAIKMLLQPNETKVA